MAHILPRAFAGECLRVALWKLWAWVDANIIDVGRAVEQSLAVYRDLALSDVVDEYEAAMQHFPVR